MVSSRFPLQRTHILGDSIWTQLNRYTLVGGGTAGGLPLGAPGNGRIAGHTVDGANPPVGTLW
jgi:hypothetical protein